MIGSPSLYKKIGSLGLIAFCVIHLHSCAETVEQKPKALTPAEVEVKTIDLYSPWVDSVYASLSDYERVAQLIWLDLDWTTTDSLTPKIMHYGGLILPEDKTVLAQLYQQVNDSSFDDKLFKLQLKGVPSITYFEKLNQLDFYKPSLTLSLDSSFAANYYHTVTQLMETYSCQFVYSTAAVSAFQFDSAINRHWQQKLEAVGMFEIAATDSLGSKNPIHIVLNSKSALKDDSKNTYFNFSNQQSVSLDSLILGAFNVYVLDSVAANALPLDTLLTAISFIAKNHPKELEFKVRKVLALKAYLNQPITRNESLTFKQQVAVLTTKLKGLASESQYMGNALVSQASTVPIIDFPKKWKYITVGKKSLTDFTKGIRHYASINEERKSNLNFNINDYTAQNPLIIVIQDTTLSENEIAEFVKKVRLASKTKKIIVVGVQQKQVPLYATLPTYINCPSASPTALYMCAQGLMGGVSFNATCAEIPTYFKSPKIRLAYTIPEEVGISADSLKKIDKIASEAIFSKATPGCQVFAAKDGKVILDKGYGYHAYDYKTAVSSNDVYDLASVTKVAATTLMAMHLYDKGKFQLNDSIKRYLPDSLTKFLKFPSRIGNITFQELLTHTSGLPSGLPIHKFIAYISKLIGRFDRYYCDVSDHLFCIEVAKDFYLDADYLDSIWVDMNRIWPGEKKFKYSDANMNVLYQVFKPLLKSKKTYDRYLDSVFYKKLGLETMTFLPIYNLDTLAHRIAPTEFDTYWRFQVLKGYVHDPNAALYGGVAGNAGLFSSAHDLGVLFQLFLNKGFYGGKKFIEPTTIALFTKHQPGSHRGLGFDKPTASNGNVVAKDAPYTSYGHSGFTGICAWGDDENQLVFSFTSNRVHPSPLNKKLIEHGIRGRMHQVIYSQLIYSGDYKNKATNNIPHTKLINDLSEVEEQ